MRKFIVIAIGLLAVLPASALDNFPVNSSLCWCVCNVADPRAVDSIPMWKLDKASCSLSTGKDCKAQQPNGTFKVGTLQSCDGCKTDSAGNCIAGTSAIKTIPKNVTLVQADPAITTTKPLAPAATAQPATIK